MIQSLLEVLISVILVNRCGLKIVNLQLFVLAECGGLITELSTIVIKSNIKLIHITITFSLESLQTLSNLPSQVGLCLIKCTIVS